MIKLSSENENVQNFLDFVHSQLKKHKFNLNLSIDSIKIGSNSIGGYFSEEERQIVVCINDNEWLSVLVHEYNHFCQYIENEPKYIILQEGENNILSELWDWLNKEIEIVSIKRKNEIFRKVIDMELDCEKRSVQMIKKFELPIDIEEYIFGAYNYIFYYLFSKKYRTWLKDEVDLISIMEIKELSKKFGGISLDQKFNKLPPDYEEIFKKYSKMP